MFQNRELKSFSIYRSEPNIFSKVRDFNHENKISMNGMTIFIKTYSLETDYIDIEFFWESTKEVPSEKLDEFGSIVVETQVVKTVVKISLIAIANSNLVYLFSKNTSVVRQSLPILEELFSVKIYSIQLDNRFFSKIIEKDNLTRVQQLSYQSSVQKNDYTISSALNNNLFLEQLDLERSNITNITLLLTEKIRVKISSYGRVALYNYPTHSEMREMLNKLNILIESYGFGGDNGQ